MKILGLITARGGSVRLPGKNMKYLGDHPLVGHAVRQAQASEMMRDVAVSTDDLAVMACAKSYGARVVERPPHLSKGDQRMQLTVVEHALASLAGDYEYVMLLQPSSPFRRAHDIRGCSMAMKNGIADTVVSVCHAPQFSAFVRPVPEGSYITERPVERPNGAIYLARVTDLAAGGHWFSGRVYGYRMSIDRSIDIDTEQDLERARQILVERPHYVNPD